MRAHILQHVPFEGPGCIDAWLDAAGWKKARTRFFESPRSPAPREVDLVIVMGGPMSVNDEREIPWLVQEKAFIREAIEAGTAVLGICLGAQMIASAMGATVRRNEYKEIGWFPVEGVSKEKSCFRFPASTDVFHWHGETFDLPAGAVHIARSEACENQGFQVGKSVIGLQFHLETTPESARELVAHCRSELVPSRFVQSEATILKDTFSKYHSANALMGEVLSYLTASLPKSESTSKP